MIQRSISKKVRQWSKQYPVITIIGPRQSGKTTLCKMLYPEKAYVSLEDIDERNFAIQDPRGFLNRFKNGAVIDEIQRVPDLLSYIQTRVDAQNKTGIFILTGSHQFALRETISQSLAGRTALVQLLPFTLKEAYGRRKKTLALEQILYTGFYPRIFDKKLNPTEAMLFYTNTYVERDVRQLINIKDLSKFELFLKLCAGRTGQILNLSNLGNDCGVNHMTIKHWIAVLEASFLIKLLKPYYKNFNKRLIKAPKLYFLDTGLASFLLDIQNEIQMKTHPLKGALFETFVVSELLKLRFNQGQTDHLYYFRDHVGNEVDLLVDYGLSVDPIEIKSSQTVSEDFFKGLGYFAKLNKAIGKSSIIYGGAQTYNQKGVEIISWQNIDAVLKERT